MTDEATTVKNDERCKRSTITWRQFVTDALELVDVSRQLNDGWEWRSDESVSNIYP